MVLVDSLPAESATALRESGQWTLTEHLLAAVVDALAVANWQRSEDGQKGRRRPRPVPRPGVPDGTVRHGNRGGRSNAEVMALLAARGPTVGGDEA